VKKLLEDTWESGYRSISFVLMKIGLFSDIQDNKLNWYSHSGHLEKSDIENKLIEVRDDNRKKELFKAI